MACHLTCRSSQLTKLLRCYLPITYYRSHSGLLWHSTANNIDRSRRTVRQSDTTTTRANIFQDGKSESLSEHVSANKYRNTCNNDKKKQIVLVGCCIGTALGLWIRNSLDGNGHKVYAAVSNNNETNCKCVSAG